MDPRRLSPTTAGRAKADSRAKPRTLGGASVPAKSKTRQTENLNGDYLLRKLRMILAARELAPAEPREALI